LRAVWDYGSKSFVTNLALMIIGRIDMIVIGVTLNVSLITFYSIGRTLVDYVSQVVATLSGSFTMHLTDLRGRGDESGLRTLFARGSRLAALLALPMAAAHLLVRRSSSCGRAHPSAALDATPDVVLTSGLSRSCHGGSRRVVKSSPCTAKF
jgi:hypothetical protein